MSDTTLLLDVDKRGVATVTLNRPVRHNALDGKMIADLQKTVSMLQADAAIRAVVLTGAGASFCAGGDLDWMRQQMVASRDERIAQARRLAEMLSTLNTLSKPLIGKVQGPAYGGGVGLLCTCDVAVAADTARFGLTETRLGLIPATIGPYVLARLGEAKARRIFMSARVFDAAEAVTLGVVARAVPPEKLDQEIEQEILPFLATAPGAVARAKALGHRLGPRIDAAVIEASVTALADAWETDEAREGVAAFFEKRKPSWVIQ